MADREPVENTAGIPSIASEIEAILEKSKHENVTPDFKINITVKDGYVDDSAKSQHSSSVDNRWSLKEEYFHLHFSHWDWPLDPITNSQYLCDQCHMPT